MKYTPFFFLLLSVFSLNVFGQCYPKHSSYIDDHGKVIDEEKVCPYIPVPIIYQVNPAPAPAPQVVIEENNSILTYGYPRRFFYHTNPRAINRNAHEWHEGHPGVRSPHSELKRH